MGFIDAEHDAILGHYFTTDALAALAAGASKVHLHTGDPGAAGTANEVSTDDWTNYEAADVNRDGVTSPFWDGPNAGAGGRREFVNDGIVDYGTATIANPVTVTHFTVRDSAGRVIGSEQLDTAQPIANGNPVPFNTGALEFFLRKAAA